MDLKDIANEYFVSDINKVYFTNEEEVKKKCNSIEFLKKRGKNNDSNKFYLF